MHNIFSRNGIILPIEEANISIANIEYSYGFGVYESIRVHKNTALFLNEHIERLLRSAEYIDLVHPWNKKIVIQWVTNLIEEIQQQDAYNIKILLIGGKEPQLSILPLSPRFVDRKLYKTGVSLCTVQYERFLPQAKTLNMLPSYIFHKRALEQDCFDMLIYNQSDEIIEGTKTNFFAIKEGVLMTAPDELVLHGVTRMHVIELASHAGISVKNKPLKKEDLQKCEGAFITSTSAKILPVSKIDSVNIPMNPKTNQLIDLHNSLLDKEKNIDL